MLILDCCWNGALRLCTFILFPHWHSDSLMCLAKVKWPVKRFKELPPDHFSSGIFFRHQIWLVFVLLRLYGQGFCGVAKTEHCHPSCVSFWHILDAFASYSRYVSQLWKSSTHIPHGYFWRVSCSLQEEGAEVINCATALFKCTDKTRLKVRHQKASPGLSAKICSRCPFTTYRC